ncbi:hypothetical protein L6164_033528 [Bauhinia variegata]|uniref:Uncharacterized protein n=1 Tax=Bauhinia variegata TaxID=167791 RepID=A0ACB9KRX4_BAUVA|nr:hypothetical protein L6164_033528 [Bauhinia variegata]
MPQIAAEPVRSSSGTRSMDISPTLNATEQSKSKNASIESNNSVGKSVPPRNADKSKKDKQKVVENPQDSSDVELIGEGKGSLIYHIPRRQTRSASRLLSGTQPESSMKMEMMSKRKIAYRTLVEFDGDDDDMKRIGKRFAAIGWKNFF